MFERERERERERTCVFERERLALQVSTFGQSGFAYTDGNH